MITLVLEAATYQGGVALLDGAELIGERGVAMRGREHEALMAAVGELLEAAKVTPRALQRVVCGAGPGSFTSLRIAGSIAKGLAMAAHIPLIPVSSLTLMAAAYRGNDGGRILATLDAMRGEYYVQLHERSAQGQLSALNEPALSSEAELVDLAESLGAVMVGPQLSGDQHAVPLAAAARLITNVIDATEPADLAAWEPAYGRLAEAQVKWEAAHGRPLPA